MGSVGIEVGKEPERILLDLRFVRGAHVDRDLVNCESRVPTSLEDSRLLRLFVLSSEIVDICRTGRWTENARKWLPLGPERREIPLPLFELRAGDARSAEISREHCMPNRKCCEPVAERLSLWR